MDYGLEKNSWFRVGSAKTKIRNEWISRWKYESGREWTKTFENIKYTICELQIPSLTIHEKTLHLRVFGNGEQVSVRKNKRCGIW